MDANLFTAVFIPLALAVIMLGMGLSLTPQHFRNVLVTPKPVALGLGLQTIGLPILALAVATLFRLPPELAVGLVLIAACPGGPTSNLIAHLAKGDTALSITLTAISSLLIIATLPFVVNFALVHFMGAEQAVRLSVIQATVQVGAIIVLPVSIGMLLRHHKPRWATRCETPVKIISALFLALVIMGALNSMREQLWSFFVMIGAAAISLNILAMALGYSAARLTSQTPERVKSITVEVGIQNGTLGIMVAASMLENMLMVIPAAIYSLVMFGSAGLVILLGNSRAGFSQRVLGSTME